MFSLPSASFLKSLRGLFFVRNRTASNSRPRPALLTVEALEERTLMAAYIAEYSVPTSGSGPIDITRGPDGNLWFAEQSAHKVARITPTGTTTEYSVSGDPVDLWTGTGTDLWFAEYSANLVGKIDTSDGQVTEYAVPTAGAGPNGITLGSDGAVWFGETLAGKIGRITSSGVITEYSVGGNPTDLALGNDGNVWFTSYGTDQVGRITTSGSSTYYSTPSGSGPAGIAAGPDGNLWVTLYNSGGVAKITTSGIISTYSIPTSNSHPWAINAGADNTLWFAESGTNKAGRISTAGLFREYALPTNSGDPRGVAVATDGSGWLTEFSGNNIAQVIAPANPTLTLTVSYGTGRNVTLSGQVTDDEPGGLTVSFSGQVVGTVITNPNGFFSGSFVASGLGTVQATVSNSLGFTSTVSIVLTSAAPVISGFTASAGVGNLWTFSGTVTDESVAGLTVTFGGLGALSGESATVQANGTFTKTVTIPPGTQGNATAQVTDSWGLQSNVATYFVSA